jgi:hypothetical protein
MSAVRIRMSNGSGYIYVKDWERFQHYSKRNPPWIKLYTILITDDDFMDLAVEDRMLLIGIWLLTSKAGNGTLQADSKRLLRRLSIPFGPRSKDPLPRLVDAGFITIRASKADSILPAPLSQSTEKPPSTDPSRTSKRKTERARTSAGTPRRSSNDEDENQCGQNAGSLAVFNPCILPRGHDGKHRPRRPGDTPKNNRDVRQDDARALLASVHLHAVKDIDEPASSASPVDDDDELI